LPVEGEGTASRDFIFVQDIVTGLMLCALAGKPGDVYNLASGTETSISHLASLINELTGNETPIEFLPRRDWDHSGRRFGSTEKAKRDIGFEAETSLREGLEKTIAWTRENLELIESCMNRHARYIDRVA
jgi:nucleoside-diphosphate-sugar epimerase